MLPESRATQARRWAKFPATVLFALSIVWLTYRFFDYLAQGSDFTEATRSGIGVLQVLINLLIIPVGGVVVGIYLLLRKRWAALAAAALPVLPLITKTGQSWVRIGSQFHEFHAEKNFHSAANAMIELFVFLAFWIAYVFMLIHLYRVWTLLRVKPMVWTAHDPGTAPNASADATKAEGEVCFLMPETEDAERD